MDAEIEQSSDFKRKKLYHFFLEISGIRLRYHYPSQLHCKCTGMDFDVKTENFEKLD